MLGEAGYRQRRDTRELVMTDPDNDIEFFFLRPRDIAVYVGSGTLDVGITGRDLFLDAQVEAVELMNLGFGASTFRFAGPVGEFSRAEQLNGKRLATSYDGLLRSYLSERGDRRLRGPVGRSGRVLRSPGCGRCHRRRGGNRQHPARRRHGDLRRPHPEIRGRADRPLRRDPPPGLAVLMRRLRGVIVAREYVMMDYDIRKDLVDAAATLTPGLESPTVSPLRDTDWVAVRSMVRADPDQPDHGRALRSRRPCHSGQHHPRLPHLIAPE